MPWKAPRPLEECCIPELGLSTAALIEGQWLTVGGNVPMSELVKDIYHEITQLTTPMSSKATEGTYCFKSRAPVGFARAKAWTNQRRTR